MSLAGTRLGPYEVLSLLGAGGMGEVYRARDTKLGREVAIKILPGAWSADPDRVARFAREAHLLAALNHPNIAAIYGLEESGPTLALVLELVAGDTLLELLRAGPVAIPEAIAIARQIADALDAAHERGIVHRDLKPANIILTPEGRVKVLDFGLAKAADAAPADLTNSPTMIGATAQGVLLGTAPYMSPEQTRGKPVDKRADIWAFGCVLYELLTGRRAFPGEAASDIIATILGREPDWSALPPATPAPISHLLRRCLEKNLVGGCGDIGDAGAELGDEALRSPAVDDNHAPRRGRRSLTPLLVTGGSLTLAAAAFAWSYFQRDAAPWENPLSDATFQRLTDFEGSELDAAVSPDGRFFLFVANRDGPFDAWVGQIGSGELVNATRGRLPDLMNDEVRTIGFSSDGQIWMRTQETPIGGAAVPVIGRTVVMPVIGGTMRQLLDAGIEPVCSRDEVAWPITKLDPAIQSMSRTENGRDAKRIFTAQRGIHCHYVAGISRPRRSGFPHH